MTPPIRFAIVGAGAIARAYETAMAFVPDARITAVCDVRRTAAQELARRIGCKAYCGVGQLLDHARFDAVIVCAPPVWHEEIVCRLLAAGKHVLCEKPLAISVEGARRMLDTAAAFDRIMTMASKFRYVPDVRKAREFVASGTIGELVFVENAFTARVDMRERWNSDPSISGGGVLIDNGTHAVDILRFFLGNLCDIQVVEGRRLQRLQVEDTVRLFVHNDEGVMGASDLSWSIDEELESFLRVYGTEGTILVGWRESKIRSHRGNEWTVIGTGYDKTHAFREQLENFCGAILGRTELVITPLDALASVEVIQAAYAALEQTRWQRIASQIEEFAPQALEVS